MNYIQKLFTSRDNGAEADSYVGQTGRIWWDPVTNSFYYSDGVTPGGFQIGGGAAGNPAGLNTQIQYNNNNVFGASASFTYDNSTQTAAVTNFTSTGNVNFSTTSNVSLGTVANIHISGGSANQVLTTDGSGNLTWAVASVTTHPAGSNTQIQFNNAGTFGATSQLTFDDVTGVMSAPLTNSTLTTNAQPNVTSLGILSGLTVSGTINLGLLSNIQIDGGHTGYFIQTDGAGTLTWAPGTGGGTPPAGNDTAIQFNNNGSFGGNANLTFNSTTNTLALNGNLITNSLQMGGGSVSNFCVMTVFSATTTSTVTHQPIWSIPLSAVTAVDFVIVATNLVTNSRQTSKITSMLLGSSVVFNEYSGMQINGGVGTFYVEYDPGLGPYLLLTVSPDVASLTTYDMMITQYRAV